MDLNIRDIALGTEDNKDEHGGFIDNRSRNLKRQ